MRGYKKTNCEKHAASKYLLCFRFQDECAISRGDRHHVDCMNKLSLVGRQLTTWKYIRRISTFRAAKALRFYWHYTYTGKNSSTCIYAGLEFGKNRGKASLALNVTKFFRASRPVWKFYSVAILKFQITFELPWAENKNIQNSNNILKNAEWNYSYHSYMYRNYLLVLRGVFLYVKL
jgi:hypothetical protein